MKKVKKTFFGSVCYLNRITRFGPENEYSYSICSFFIFTELQINMRYLSYICLLKKDIVRDSNDKPEAG